MDHDTRCDETADHRVEQEHQEVLVVIDTDAIADPRTVMVHSEDASAADRAVVGSRRSH